MHCDVRAADVAPVVLGFNHEANSALANTFDNPAAFADP